MIICREYDHAAEPTRFNLLIFHCDNINNALSRVLVMVRTDFELL
jgi:hypothetical protein